MSSSTPGNSAWVEREGFSTDVKMCSGLVGALATMGFLEMVNYFSLNWKNFVLSMMQVSQGVTLPCFMVGTCLLHFAMHL